MPKGIVKYRRSAQVGVLFNTEGAEGGGTPPAAPAEGTPAPPARGDEDAPEDLGDAGKQAIERMKRDKRAAEKRATELEARVKEFEDRDKSDAEKVADRVAKAESEVAGIPAKVAEALKGHLVALHEISDEDSELFLTATDPELLLKQIARLQERNADTGKPRQPKPDPTQGRVPGGTPLDPKAADLAQIEADLAAGSRRG